MLVDRTTEAISHFIGLFALKVEQERLRDAYEEFTAERRQEDLVPVEPLAPEVAHDHELRATNPKPKAPAPDETREEARLDVPRWNDGGTPGDGPLAPLLDLQGELATVAGPGLTILPPPELLMPPAGVPGSILTVTVQVARLEDNDIVGEGNFRDAVVHAADLAAAAGLAASLHAPEGPGRAEIPTLDAALALRDSMLSFAPAVQDGVEVYTSLGQPVPQKIVNGQVTEEVPDWKDLLPAYHQEEDEADGLEDWELPEFYRPNPDAPDGHSIVAGGNLLVNEANIALSYLDAPLIAVGGTWISLDIVSQVAVVSNHDSGLSVGDEGATAVYQIVEVEAKAKTAGWTVPGKAGAEAPPMKLTVEIVEGDLLVANTIDQIIELLDNDAFAMSILAANSAWILGANIVVNATSLVTAGFGYDLILIGGNFISVDTIHQTLVLLDDDVVAPGIAGGPAMGAFDTATALAVEGRTETAEGVPEGIAALPDRPTEAEEDEPTVDPAPDNLLVNKALLKTVGVDTHAALTESLAGILANSTDDLEALREKLMTDPALAGLEQARVLKINGDLILSNTINQTILASDRDDIFVDGAAPPGLDVIAGQNAMLNAASISIWGVDSKVMTQTEVYSDLLIHQAKLVDEPDAPEVADPGLVNEAVAFLMEDIDSAVAGKTADIAYKASPAAVDSHDMMQSNLI
jgi:hypothetical protein